jgi:dCMP deaminase
MKGRFSAMSSLDPKLQLRERPSWDVYFLKQAFEVATRSPDPSIQHGCVLVRDNIPVMSGYNGLPSGGDDSLYPLTRPEKYYFFSHAEFGAVCLAARRGVSTDGCCAYVTGLPCVNCLLALWQAGIRRVVHANRRGYLVLDAEQDWARDLLVRNTGLVLLRMDVELS